MGKGRVAQALVDHFAGNADTPILVLVPAALTRDFASGLKAGVSDYIVDVVDRRRFRELLSGVPDVDATWSSANVVVMSIDLATRDDVWETLVATRWSLLVVDEAHALGGKRGRLVRALSEASDRVLLLSGVDESAALGEIVSRLHSARWSRDEADVDGRSLFAAVPRELHVLEYSRSTPERSFLANLRAFADRRMFADASHARFVARLMERSAASSPTAIEQLLLGQHERLLARHDEPFSWSGLATATDQVDDHEFVAQETLWRDLDGAVSDLADLIAELEALPPDSKAERLRAHLRDVAATAHTWRMCVFTLFASTAEYLTEVIAGDGHDAWLLTGRDTLEQRHDIIASFTEGEGVLVATQAVISQRVDLSRAHFATHYDLPDTRIQMEQLWGRLDRVGQTQTVHAYAFHDATNTFEWEDRLLREYGFVD